MHQTCLTFFSFSSGVAGAGLALTPINHSFTGQEIAKQVNLLPMPLFYIQVEVYKAPRLVFILILYLSNSTTANTGTAMLSRLKRQVASGLSPTPPPREESLKLSGKIVLQLSYLQMVRNICPPSKYNPDPGKEPNLNSLLSHPGSTRPPSPPTEHIVAQVDAFDFIIFHCMPSFSFHTVLAPQVCQKA